MTPMYKLYKHVRAKLKRNMFPIGYPYREYNTGTRDEVESMEISSTRSNPSISSVGRRLGSRYD
jgi:hypothetical protein